MNSLAMEMELIKIFGYGVGRRGGNENGIRILGFS